MDRDVYEEWFELETRHWWFVGRRTLFMELLDLLLRKAGQRRNGQLPVVDIGCGTGINLDDLSRFGRVIGVDVSPQALAFCRQRKAYALCQAPMDRLPFRSGSIGLLTALDVLEHGEDDNAMLREVYRVCAPGARVVFSVPAYQFMWGDHDVAAHHYRRYSTAQIRNRIVQSGFEIDRLTHLNTFLFPVSVVFRQTKNLVVHALRKAGFDVKVKSDFRSTAPPLINTLLLRVFCAEFQVLKQFNLPFGLSILCIARKPFSPPPDPCRTCSAG